MTTPQSNRQVLGCGVYSAADALRLLNFRVSTRTAEDHPVSRQTVARWLRGYTFPVKGEPHWSPPLWEPDYANDDQVAEVSFRDLIELRFVRAFRDAGVGLQTIRECFRRAVDLIGDDRPFSTQRFHTDGRTIFHEIAKGTQDGALEDLRQQQTVFRSFVAPTFKDLEFGTDAVARWFPFGRSRPTVVVDPAFAFGKPISTDGHVPTEVLALAAKVEGSPDRAARAFDVPISAVRDAVAFEAKLALETADRQQPSTSCGQGARPTFRRP